MNDTDLLLRIVNKTIDNGFDFCEWQLKSTNIPLYGLMEGNIKQLYLTNYYKLLLLDKEFAKAFWGNVWCIPEENCAIIGNEEIPAWQYFLQQMVIEEDLISYYVEFLGENNEKSEDCNKETN